MENNEASEFADDNAIQPGSFEVPNSLVEQIISVFVPINVPEGRILYAGDGDFIHFDEKGFAELGLTFDSHARLPNVVIYEVAKDRLLLIEAVTSHGPINEQRREELCRLFGKPGAEQIFITALLARSDLEEFFEEIAWETVIWMADCPTHYIHLGGLQLWDQFLSRKKK